MLRILQLSGDELTRVPLEELSDVRALKQRLHEQQGLPPRFRQRLLHEGCTLEDSVKLESEMDLQVVALTFSDVSDDQRRALVFAARDGNVVKVEAMLQIPMDPDDAVKGERDGHDTALMVALSTVHADTGCFEVARLLLEAGARVDVRSRIRGERTPLMVAARTGQTLLVRLLLDAGAGVDLRDSRGYTALMHAAGSGFEDVVMLLLAASAEKNWLDLGGQTALDLATGKGHEEVRQVLLKAGARSGSIMRFQEPQTPRHSRLCGDGRRCLGGSFPAPSSARSPGLLRLEAARPKSAGEGVLSNIRQLQAMRPQRAAVILGQAAALQRPYQD